MNFNYCATSIKIMAIKTYRAQSLDAKNNKFAYSHLSELELG